MWYLCVKSGFVIMKQKMNENNDNIYDYHISLNMGMNNSGIFDSKPVYLKNYAPCVEICLCVCVQAAGVLTEQHQL